VFRQTTDDFLRCLENAFHHIGGVSETLVIDNLRAAVSHPDWFDSELVPKLSVFARHYWPLESRVAGTLLRRANAFQGRNAVGCGRGL
jgi:transposase